MSKNQPSIIKLYGITQNPETKSHMMVLKYARNGKLLNYLFTNDIICEKCKCICNVKHFQLNFNNWNSGNHNINKFIRDTQLSVSHSNNKSSEVLEWIPHNRFNHIKNIAKGGFGEVYKANWIDGYIRY